MRKSQGEPEGRENNGGGERGERGEGTGIMWNTCVRWSLLLRHQCKEEGGRENTGRQASNTFISLIFKWSGNSREGEGEANEGERMERDTRRRKTKPSRCREERTSSQTRTVLRLRDFGLSAGSKWHVTLKSSWDFVNETLAHTHTLYEACFMTCIHQTLPAIISLKLCLFLFCFFAIVIYWCDVLKITFQSLPLIHLSCVSQPVWRREVLSGGEEALQIL